LQFARTAPAPALAEAVTANPDAALQAVIAGLGIAKPAEAATGTAVSLLAMLSGKFKQSLANTGDSALAQPAPANPANLLENDCHEMSRLCFVTFLLSRKVTRCHVAVTKRNRDNFAVTFSHENTTNGMYIRKSVARKPH
jgi:hypothetical protein